MPSGGPACPPQEGRPCLEDLRALAGPLREQPGESLGKGQGTRPLRAPGRAAWERPAGGAGRGQRPAGRPEGGRFRAERGYRGQGPILDGFHSGGLALWTEFRTLRLLELLTAHRVLDINGTIPCSKIGIFQSGTIPGPVWVLKTLGFSSSSPFGSLKTMIFPFRSSLGPCQPGFFHS